MDDKVRFGDGRISGGFSVAIGLLCVAAVLCLRFPAWLTTPELHQQYVPYLDWLRLILAITMGVGVTLALVSFLLNRRKHMGAIGLSAILLAMLLGGPYAPQQPFEYGRASVGLDWLVLDLFFTGVAFITLERVFARVVASQGILRPGWRMDLLYFTLNHLGIGVFLLTSNHFAHDLFGWAVNPWLQSHVGALPGWLRFVLVILAADLVEYVSHRAYHEVPFLWRIHAVHHSPQYMDWLSGSRLHVTEVLITRAMILVPIFLLGFPQDTVFLYVIFVTVQSVVIHANLAWDLGWLRFVLVTPHFHHWHHASDEEALDKNYCAHTPLWDYVFGTAYAPKGRWPKTYGTVKPIPGNFFQQLAYPFRYPVDMLIERAAPGKRRK